MNFPWTRWVSSRDWDDPRFLFIIAAPMFIVYAAALQFASFDNNTQWEWWGG